MYTRMGWRSRFAMKTMLLHMYMYMYMNNWYVFRLATADQWNSQNYPLSSNKSKQHCMMSLWSKRSLICMHAGPVLVGHKCSHASWLISEQVLRNMSDSSSYFGMLLVVTCISATLYIVHVHVGTLSLVFFHDKHLGKVQQWFAVLMVLVAICLIMWRGVCVMWCVLWV